MSDTRPDSGPEEGTTAPDVDAMLNQAEAMLKEQDAVLHSLATARERVGQAAQRLAEGDWGRDASAALRQALRDLTELQDGQP